jgi:hypothetical protein
MDNKEVQDEQVSAEILASRAQAKLARKFLDIEVCNNKTAIEGLENVVIKLKERGDSADQIKLAEQKIEELKKDTISAALVPLSPSDELMVQGFVRETVLQSQKMGFDDDVQLFVMYKAQLSALAFLATRQRGKHKESYFRAQTDVTRLDEQTLLALTQLYTDSFVLTEDERKNS